MGGGGGGWRGGEGGSNIYFHHPGGRAEGLENKKKGASMVQGQVFLIFQDLSFLHLEITLLFAKLCYTPLQNYPMHLKKIVFLSHHNFGKKKYSKLSKNESENIQTIKITYL